MSCSPHVLAHEVLEGAIVFSAAHSVLIVLVGQLFQLLWIVEHTHELRVVLVRYHSFVIWRAHLIHRSVQHLLHIIYVLSLICTFKTVF